MYDDLNERIFYNPGDLVTIKHDLPYKPTMFVIEKCTRSLMNENKEKENIFLGIKCRWFDLNGDLQEALFSTKDLVKI